MAAALPTYPSFDCTPEGRAVRWRKWVQRLQTFFVAYAIDDTDRQKALLLTFAGDELNDIVDTFPAEALHPGERETVFSRLVDRVTDHFNPQANVEFQRYVFRKSEQKTDNIDEFYCDLKQLAETCGFADAPSEIKSQLIAGCKSNKVREKGLSTPAMTLADLLAFARTLQLTTQQSKAMHAEVHKLDAVRNRYKHHPSRQQHREKQSSSKCNNCGGEWPHKGGQKNCPAFNRQCKSCAKMNHFASMCRSTPQQTQPASKHSYGKHRPLNHRKSKSNVRHVNDDEANVIAAEPGDSSETEYIFAMYRDNSQLPHFIVKVQGHDFEFLADSGATIDIMSRDDFNRILPRPVLQPSNKKISAYGSPRSIPVIGAFNAVVRHKSMETTATIHVVQQKEKAILGWKTCQALNLLATVHHVKPVHAQLREEFSDLFVDVGKLNDQKIKLHIDKNVQPVAQQYRRVPFHVRKDIEEQLQKDEELGIIEKASGPTPWVSPVVVVPKPKQPGKVRVCVDMRAANKAIRRERHATPTLDELKTMFAGATVFSKLDLTQGYNQLELDEDSRYITTFATHKGLYRYRRLFFGINSASEIFQETIRQALSGLDGVVNISDDIMCYGTNQAHHDRNLRALFERLRQKGLTLNDTKCVYNKESLEFLGHVFGKDGITPSQDKLDTILNLPTPANASEVRSLLGMMNFCGAHHIPNYAALTHELRHLTKKTTPWSWTQQHDAALTKLQTALSEATTLAYFDPRKTSEIYTDGSPVGISAVLTQDGRIIQFASRPLTPTEQRYSQTEREALAVTWACEYFHIYIFGAPCTVHTDHKPLVSIFNNPRSRMSTRIERWAMRLQPYDITVKYRPGADNPADYLSRHPVQQSSSDREEKIAEEYINYVMNNSLPKAMTIDEVATETAADPTLTAVIHGILTNQWHMLKRDVDIATYQTLYQCRSELSVTQNAKVILKGNQIVLPASLQDRAVKLAHSGHQGIVKTIALLREKVWFKSMQRSVEATVKNCMKCQISTLTPAREPLKMSPLPCAPWTELSADFGHLPNGKYILVVMDEYSRYPIVDILDSTSARSAIPKLDKIFAEFGIPETLKTDNGPPFNSADFANFCSHMGVIHRKITPLWPRANAETERFMRSIKKTIKSATTPNFKQEMHRFLLDYRTTPHSTTGVSPASLLFGRNLRSRLPQLPQPRDDHVVRQRDTAQKELMKKYADDKAYVKPSNLQLGDPVLLKSHDPSKADTPYQSSPLVIVNNKGSMITAQRGQQKVTRNSSFFKKAPRHPSDAELETEQEVTLDPDPNPEPLLQTTPAPNTPQPPRRSTREVHKPRKFDDYVMNKP